MAKQYKVIGNNGKAGENKIVEVVGGVGRNGQPVRIKAEQGLKYQLQEMQRHQETAPDHVKVKRIGKDLHVIFQGQRDADLIIEGYYEVMTTPYNGLVGRAENGSFYEYIPEDPSVKGLVPNLREGALPINVALGGAEVSGAGAAIAGAAFGGFGALGLIGGVAAGVLGGAAIASVANKKSSDTGTVPVDPSLPGGGGSDGITPTIAITSNKAALAAGQTATITFTLSEASSDFTRDDITVVGGALGPLTKSATDPKVYTATFTPDVNSTAESIISVASSTFKNAAGVQNADGADGDNTLTMTTNTVVVDTVSPSIIVSSNKTNLLTGQTATITFTLSEPSTDFMADDVLVSGGTLSNFQGSGPTYTATFTPDVNSTADSRIAVASGKFSDAAGNVNNDGSDANNTVTMPTDTTNGASGGGVDVTSPTVAITSDRSSLSTGQVAAISFTLSEASTDFTAADVTVSGGSLSNFSGSGTSYTATFTPSPNSTANAVIRVSSLRFRDAAGNLNIDGSDANNMVTIQMNTTAADTTAPTISVSSDKSSLSSGQTATITFALSEASTDFASSDVVVSGGTLSNFQGSGTSYTATFTPDANSTADSSLYVPSSSFSDAAGNTNTDGAQADNLVTLPTNTTVADTIAPTIAISSNKSSLSSGQSATITFTLSEASTDFTVADVAVSGGTLSNFQGSGTSYTATLTPNTNSTTNSTVSVASLKFRDAAGNLNNDGSDANNTVTMPTNTMVADTIAPTITVSSDKTQLLTGDTATITFTLSEPSNNFTLTDVVVSGGTLSNFQGNSTSYTAIFTPDVNSTADSGVYVPSGSFSDAAGNINTDGGQVDNLLKMTTNTLVIDTSPTIAVTTDKASLKTSETANITFTLSQNSTDFTASDVVVTGGTLSHFQGSGTSYSAVFTPAPNSTLQSVISVASQKFSNVSGVQNKDGADADNTVSMPTDTTVDITPPTVSISSDRAQLNAGQTATITFTLSEISTDFTVADVNVKGGGLSNFQGSGKVYTATFTPTANSLSDSVIQVSSLKFKDAAGNDNIDGADGDNQVTMVTNTMTLDTTAPTIAISSDKSSLSNDETSLVTFTLSENSGDFTDSDVTVVGGTLSPLQQSMTDAKVYTAVFTPNANATIDGVIHVASAKFSDAAGNSNTDGADANNTITILNTQVTNWVTQVVSDGKPQGVVAPLLTGGSPGDDQLLVSGKTDVVTTGIGNDVITLSDTALKGLNAIQGVQIDGGDGLDTLVLPQAANLMQEALQLLRAGAMPPATVTTVGSLAGYLQTTFTSTQLDAIKLQDVLAVLPGSSSTNTFLSLAMMMLGLSGASSLNQALSALQTGSMSGMTLSSLQSALSMYTGQTVNIDTVIDGLIGGAVTFLANDNPQLQTMGEAFVFLQSSVSFSILNTKTLGDLMGLANSLQPDGRLTQLFKTVAQLEGISTSDSLSAVISKMQGTDLWSVPLVDLGTTVADQLAVTGTITDVREGIDLTDPAVAAAVKGIEVFDLRAAGSHKLTMNVSNVLNLASGAPGADKQVLVQGGADDTVSLSSQYSNGVSAGSWAKVSTAPVALQGVSYDVYQNAGEPGVQVLVQTGMQVQINGLMPLSHVVPDQSGQTLVGDLEEGPTAQSLNTAHTYISADFTPKVTGQMNQALQPTWKLDLYRQDMHRLDSSDQLSAPELIAQGLTLDSHNNWTYQEPLNLDPGHQYTYYTVLSDTQSSLHVKSNEYTIQICNPQTAYSFSTTDQILDLSALTGDTTVVQTLDVIDMTGHGHNTLKLSLNDVLHFGAINAFPDTSTNGQVVQMKIDGDAGDVVELKDLVGATDPGAWVQASANVTINNHAYKVFNYAPLHAQLLIDANIQHTLVSTGSL
jgi:hypothetical protein